MAGLSVYAGPTAGSVRRGCLSDVVRFFHCTPWARCRLDVPPKQGDGREDED